MGKAEECTLDAYSFLDDFRKEVERYPFDYEGTKLHVTMTFGLSYVAAGKNVNAAMTDADEKLYVGKNSGKNKVVTGKTTCVDFSRLL